MYQREMAQNRDIRTRTRVKGRDCAGSGKACAQGDSSAFGVSVSTALVSKTMHPGGRVFLTVSGVCLVVSLTITEPLQLSWSPDIKHAVIMGKQSLCCFCAVGR